MAAAARGVLRRRPAGSAARRRLPRSCATERVSRSEAVQIRDEGGNLLRRVGEELVGRELRLAAVGGDGLGERGRPTVVEVGRAEAEAPEWRGAELATGRASLDDAVGEAGAHVVQQEVGEEQDLLVAEG